VKKNTYTATGFTLYAALALAPSIAAPRQLLAGAPTFSAQQGGGPDRGQQQPSQRLPRGGDNTSGNHQSRANSRPAQGGGEPHQSRPPRPNSAPNQTSPPTGGPITNPGNPSPGPVRPPRPSRPPRPTPRPPVYHYPPFGPRRGFIWGGGNGWRLHQFFMGEMHPIDLAHRRQLYVGGYIPFIYLPHVQLIPTDLMVYLPPVPPGYEIGYYDGYCFVYDPHTLLIVSLIDLYRY